MTKDIKAEIRDQYINEYVESAGAQKQGIFGKIWRGAMKLDAAMARLQKEPSWKTPLLMVGLPMGLAISLFAAPTVFLGVIGTAAALTVSFLRADVLVRRDAWNNVTRDIDAGLLSDRFTVDVLDKRAAEIELQRASLPVKGAAVTQFAASAASGGYEPEPLATTRGIERPHGRNFG